MNELAAKPAARAWGPVGRGDAHLVSEENCAAVRSMLEDRPPSWHEEHQVTIAEAMIWITSVGWTPEQALTALTMSAGMPGRIVHGHDWRVLGTRDIDVFELTAARGPECAHCRARRES
jgi:hypothetical protein